MKKTIIFLFLILGFIRAQADDTEPAIHFFHKDSIVASFLRSDVDSMTYSYLNMDNVRQEKISTHVIHLKNNQLYRIPASIVDSVVFTPPSSFIWTVTRDAKDVSLLKGTMRGSCGGKLIEGDMVEEVGFIVKKMSDKNALPKIIPVQKTLGKVEYEFNLIEDGIDCETDYKYQVYVTISGEKNRTFVGQERPLYLTPIQPYVCNKPKIEENEEACDITVYADLVFGDVRELDEAGIKMGFFYSHEKFDPNKPNAYVRTIPAVVNEKRIIIEGHIDNHGYGNKIYYAPFIEVCNVVTDEPSSFETPPQIKVETLGAHDIGAVSAKAGISLDVKMHEGQLKYGVVGIQKVEAPDIIDDRTRYEEFGSWFAPTPHQEYGVDFDDLTPNTTYYYRAYAIIDGIYYYGEVLSFTTNIIVKTYEATDVGATVAHVEGELMTKDAMLEGERFGFCYNTTGNPDENSPGAYGTFKSTSTPNFTWDMTNLEPETTYYYRAYVTYKGKTYFGEVMTFTTEGEGIMTLDCDYAMADIAKFNVWVDNTLPVEQIGFTLGLTSQADELGVLVMQTNAETIKSQNIHSIYIYNLTPSQTYYYRAYMIVNGKVCYGKVKVLQTSWEIDGDILDFIKNKCVYMVDSQPDYVRFDIKHHSVSSLLSPNTVKWGVYIENYNNSGEKYSLAESTNLSLPNDFISELEDDRDLEICVQRDWFDILDYDSFTAVKTVKIGIYKVVKYDDGTQNIYYSSPQEFNLVYDREPSIKFMDVTAKDNYYLIPGDAWATVAETHIDFYGMLWVAQIIPTNSRGSEYKFYDPLDNPGDCYATLNCGIAHKNVSSMNYLFKMILLDGSELWSSNAIKFSWNNDESVKSISITSNTRGMEVSNKSDNLPVHFDSITQEIRSCDPIIRTDSFKKEKVLERTNKTMTNKSFKPFSINMKR